jgi:hypothetical protein
MSVALVVGQLLAFGACVGLSFVPNVQTNCRFDTPIAVVDHAPDPPPTTSPDTR